MKDGGDYTRRQAIRDAQHAEAYRAWVKVMSGAEREKLRRLGIHEPDTSYHGTGMSERDLAETPLASEAPDIAAMVDPEVDSPPEPSAAADIDERVMDVLRRLLGEVLTQKNARLTLECLAVACGLTTLEGESMTSIARRHGLSRAAVSKRCVDITEKLNLPPPRAMRSTKARKVYRKVQKQIRKHYERTGHSERQIHHP